MASSWGNSKFSLHKWVPRLNATVPKELANAPQGQAKGVSGAVLHLHEQLEMSLRNTTGLPISAALELEMLDGNISDASLQSCCLWIRQTSFLTWSVILSLRHLTPQQVQGVHCCLGIVALQVSLSSCTAGINKWQFPNAILWFPKTQLSSPHTVCSSPSWRVHGFIPSSYSIYPSPSDYSSIPTLK